MLTDLFGFLGIVSSGNHKPTFMLYWMRAERNVVYSEEKGSYALATRRINLIAILLLCQKDVMLRNIGNDFILVQGASC